MYVENLVKCRMETLSWGN